MDRNPSCKPSRCIELVKLRYSKQNLNSEAFRCNRLAERHNLAFSPSFEALIGMEGVIRRLLWQNLNSKQFLSFVLVPFQLMQNQLSIVQLPHSFITQLV